MKATEGDYVVFPLMDDALAVERLTRDCISAFDRASELERGMLIQYVHYVFARPIGTSDLDKTDADRILDALLATLMTTAPDLDYGMIKRLLPRMHQLLSGGDPAAMHIRPSTFSFLKAMTNGGLALTDDDSKLLALLRTVESLQVEVKVFVDTVLKTYRLTWSDGGAAPAQADRDQVREIQRLRDQIREDAERIMDERD
jgi:hypothetical protein